MQRAVPGWVHCARPAADAAAGYAVALCWGAAREAAAGIQGDRV
jgi:hypothetical protein